MFLLSYKTLFKAAPTHFDTTASIGVMSVSHRHCKHHRDRAKIVRENNAEMRAVELQLEDVVDL